MLKPIALSLQLCLVVSFAGSAQVNMQDSLALVSMYHATNGTEWTVDSNWLAGPVSTWHGVTLTEDRVTRLELRNNNLTDSLPPDLGNLAALERLDIANNALTGRIPGSIGQCAALEHLDFHVNMITGSLPASMAGCTSLTSLIAYKNQLNGGFPSVLLDMPQLMRIQLGSNDLEGPIPSEINTLVNLRNLAIERNNFTGIMPSIKDLTELVEVHIRENQLEGDWSQIIGYHPNMYYFTFNDNRFTGCVSDTSFNPERLQFLHLNNNAFDCLGDFSGFADTGVLERIWCGGNSLPFDDLEKNVNVNIYEYAPQDSLLGSETHTVQNGDTIVIDAGTGGEFTTYTWYHNNSIMAEESDRTLVLTGIQPSDAGSYYCAAVNTMLPDLTLYRHKVYVELEGATSALQRRELLLSCYPNPVKDKLYFHGLEDEGTILMFATTGQLVASQTGDLAQGCDMSGLPAGSYQVVIKTADEIITDLVIKM